MASRRRTTKQRGYSGTHPKLQQDALAAWHPGDPCTRCHQPMWQRWVITRSGRKVSAIHLAHTPDRTGYEGLQHAHCNTSEGASRGNRMRGQRKAAARTLPAQLRTSRAW